MTLVRDVTGLEAEDFKSKRICYVDDIPRLEYAWDSGIAIGRYLQFLKKGKLIGTFCQKCKRTVIPPRIFCELCFRPMDKWVELQDTGTVNTFSICHVTWDMQKVAKPIIPAVIEIEGASKGIGILHLLNEVDPKAVKIGMRVKAVWKPAKERQAAITDIKYFQPV